MITCLPAGLPEDTGKKQKHDDDVHPSLEKLLKCSFTSTETLRRLIRDGEPRTATLTLTQLLSSDIGEDNPDFS